MHYLERKCRMPAGGGLRIVIVRLYDARVINMLHDEQLRGVLESRGREASNC